MSTISTPDRDRILDEVRGWPAQDRLTLAREILQTLEGSFPGQPARRKSLRDLLGAVTLHRPAPSDEECEELLEAELLRKYGR
jgi:hypothetical protein